MGQYYGWAIGGYKCEAEPETNDSMAVGLSSRIGPIPPPATANGKDVNALRGS